MSSRFEIHTEPCEPEHAPPARFEVRRSDRCIACGECVSRCIYDVHERQPADPRRLAEPASHRCRGCLVCPQMCPRRALEVVRNPALSAVGQPPFDAASVLTIWQEATDGKIPVRGAGYGGPFSGEGFDGIWTDMSEIVRPTRDGIHGREHISTTFSLGRKLPDLAGLRFDDEGRLVDRIPLTREIPLPVLLGPLPLGRWGMPMAAALARAARELQTFALLDLDTARGLVPPPVASEVGEVALRYLRENRNHVVLRLGDADFDAEQRPIPPADEGDLLHVSDLLRWSSVLVLADHPAILERVLSLREQNPDLIVIAEVPAAPDSPGRVVRLARAGVDAIHVACGWRGTWADGTGGPHRVTEAIRAAHLALVEEGIRDELTLLVSGGIARAEHVPKAILLGADAVVLDVALLAAMGCDVCGACERGAPCPQGLDGLDPRWGVRRLVNLMAAWRNQLLEVLGAMGMREVRRLRGEVGRGLFASELEGELYEGLSPLGDEEEPLEVPLQGGRPPAAGAPERMRMRFGRYRVSRLDDCQGCGVCTAVCTRGVLPWPGGLRRPPPPVEERCEGPDCGDGCSAACPNGALRIEVDDRLGVLDNRRWTHRMIVDAWDRAEGLPASGRRATIRGASGGGFDRMALAASGAGIDPDEVDLSLELNRRGDGPSLRLAVPFYGGGMSYGSVSLAVMTGRARAAQRTGTLTCTGEGGFPEELEPFAAHVITQVATGYFGVSEQRLRGARMIEFKYAQGAKPGLGGHLLGDKNTPTVARLREAVPGTALFSPFPFHSVYSIEDHRKHIDWVRQVNPDALVSVKVSTPRDVDMVAVGSYHAGANVVHLDGAYGGTGAAPEIAKKNIAMPIELALSRTHRFLVSEGIRDELTLVASGGLRTPADVVRAIALGADGVVVGTAELIAMGCVLCRNCEKDRGCPRGIATTDEPLAAFLDADWIADRLCNMYRAWEAELRCLIAGLGLRSVAALRGRSDLLRLLPEGAP